jgi:hypothetical protein
MNKRGKHNFGNVFYPHPAAEETIRSRFSTNRAVNAFE